jgi:hypothetical protein
MAFPFFTIGHSTRPRGEFIDLLVASEVGLVVDVRTIPRSRTNPQYNREALPGSLSGCRIAYEHAAELGGRRAREEYCAGGQRLLGEPELSQLCRLCDGRGFSFWPRQAARTGRSPVLRRDVRGGSVVAVPPPDHCGLPARRDEPQLHRIAVDSDDNGDRLGCLSRGKS